MKLKALLQDVCVRELRASPELEISRVVYDSRECVPGCLFVAVAGFATDGNRFIPMALEKGAAAVVTAKRPQGDVPYVLVDSDRLALARLGINFYGNPAKDLILVGVTGTNGKTSVTFLVKHILETAAGAKVGLIGTMGNRIGDTELPGERTTPESFALQGLISRMQAAGCRYVVMEVSSHAIALERVAGLHYAVAAFTNLTEDHLDFHKTMEAYCRTKAELFGRCDRAVINRDDPYGPRMAEKAAGTVLETSRHPGGGLWAEDVELRSDGVRFTAVLGQERAAVRLSIPGDFTVSNALTALGIAVSLGIPLTAAAEALATAPGIRGRIEVVPTPGKPYTVLIDYAHTPDGLENILKSVRRFCPGRLIAVFGCGGDRDPMKRPIMGKIATDLADFTIISSDNPRTEPPMAIIADILKGVTADSGRYCVIENRPAAIRHALDIGQKGDIIVLAGKGHETYQEIGGVKHHLDEREVVAACLAETEDTNG